MSIQNPSKIHVVVAVITRNEQVLLALRPQGKPYAGYWEFPGGKVNKQEAEFAALARELREEIGIELSKATKLFNQAYVYADQSVDLAVWQVLEFTGRPTGLEGQELRWLAWDKLAELNLLAANYQIIDKIQDFLL